MAAPIKANHVVEEEEEEEYVDVDVEGEEGGLISSAMTVAVRPARVLVSRTALRAYLTTILAVFTVFTLLGAAITAYTLFYWSYIPQIGFSRPLHLQFDHVLRHEDSRDIYAPHPHATTSLSGLVTSAQAYDIGLELTLPHTPSNLAAGNFMLDVQLLAPSSTISPATPAVLAQARRPALLPYRSRLVQLSHTLLSLPYYALGFRSETTTLSIPAFSRVEFARGWGQTPSTLRLEVQSIHVLQIEKAEVHFRARFRGLRWIMYNHRILSAVVFVSMFWAVECIFAAFAWGFVSLYLAAPVDEVQKEPKAERDDKRQKEIQELQDFPDYAALSGIALPDPYLEFDIKKAMPRPYRPFRWAYHQTMCRSRLNSASFLPAAY
jgi:hypothetical protein